VEFLTENQREVDMLLLKDHEFLADHCSRALTKFMGKNFKLDFFRQAAGNFQFEIKWL
jgi:hypothetical protein